MLRHLSVLKAFHSQYAQGKKCCCNSKIANTFAIFIEFNFSISHNFIEFEKKGC
jgi:hypothetical protein